MKITGISATTHRIGLPVPFRPSWDTRPRTEFVVHLVRVRTDEGLEGVAAGEPMAGFAGHEDLFLGHDPTDLDRHFQVIENLSFHYGRCWPLDVALWDLYGKIVGEPCWRLLGGNSNRVRCYASTGTLKTGEELAELARRLLEAGFPAMKIRFHRKSWRSDLETVKAVRHAIGSRMDLMVDCNQAWRMPWDTAPPWTVEDALRVARELEALDVHWMEEPLHRGDYSGLAALRKGTDVPIAGGEMTRELHELRELITRGCIDVLQPDAVLAGGLTGLSRVASLAGRHGVEFTPHTWGNGIGLLANVHLAAGAARSHYLEFPLDPPEWTPEVRDFPLTTPITCDGAGYLALSDRPGLGLELDEDRLARSTDQPG